MEKLVSIVILNWNGKEVLLECLESLKKLDYSNYEIIVVDNASSDGSCEILEESYPYVKLIKNKENTGVARGNNIGIKHSQGEYILLLNNDTIIDSQLLKELLKVLENGNNGILSDCNVGNGAEIGNDGAECDGAGIGADGVECDGAGIGADGVECDGDGIGNDKEGIGSFGDGDDGKVVGVVGPKIYYYDEPQRIWAAGGGEINWLTGNVRLFGGDEIDTGQYDHITEMDYVSGCALFTRREVFEKIGYLDEIYFAYFEETDWCVRASKAGYKLLYAPQAKMWHKVRSSSRTISGFHEYQMTRNMFWFMKKHLDKQHYRNFLIYFFIIKLWFKIGVYLFYDKEFKVLKPFFKGIIDGIK